MYNYFLTRKRRLMNYDSTNGKRGKKKKPSNKNAKISYPRINSRWKQQATSDQISSCVSILRLCTCVVYNTAYVKKNPICSNWGITFKIAVNPQGLLLLIAFCVSNLRIVPTSSFGFVCYNLRINSSSTACPLV